MSPGSPVFATARRSALTLGERLAGAAHPSIAPATPRDLDDEPVHRWRKTLDNDGSVKFDRRLRWDGLKEQEVRAALSAQPDQRSLPAWTILLEEACAAAGRESEAHDRAIDPMAPIPFEEILLPFVQIARRRLRAAVTRIDRIIVPAAQISLERALLSELSEVADQALLVDFSVAGARKGGWGFSLGGPRRTGYLEFVNALRAARLAPLVERYPVLVRVLAVRCTLWVDSCAELVQRTESDAPALSALFDAGDLGAVVDVHAGRGDTHCGGRAVATVQFASGLTVMYKPRSMQLDLAFYGLLAWLGERGLEPAQRVLRILDCDEYGWMEYVRPAAVANEAELRDYYERAGALVCLAYVLGAGDLHADNLIAVGPHPMIVDLETTMCPPVQGAKPITQDGAQLAVSVLRSLLLPFWNVGQNGALFFRGGGLGIETESLRSSEHVWSFVNTDRMVRERRAMNLKEPTNVPRFDDRLVPPTERTEDIVRGFSRCHAFLEAHRDELTAAGGALDRFRGRRVRVLVRDTHVYATALRRSLHPRYLHDGFERSLQLEVLRLSVLGNDERVAHWRAFEAEQRDLEDLDYPFFWALTDGTILHDSRGTEVGTFSSISAYDQVVNRLTRLDATDREHQESLIRFIYAYTVGPIATLASASGRTADGNVAIDAPMAVAEARAIAGALEALVLRDRDGSAQWVGIDREQSTAGLVLRRLPDRLYDGRVGIALFLAALDSVGATGHSELAREALEPLRQTLRDPHRRDALTRRIGIGAGFGIGGYVYAFAQIGRLLNDASWIDDARFAARAITPDIIATDAVLEILGGAAGAAMGLLSLYELTGEPWLRARAEACALHLLGAATEEPVTHRRAWQLKSDTFATGFAHGAGGIAAALLRLATATGDERFAAAAAHGFAFEDSIQDPTFSGASHLAAESSKANVTSPWRQTWCNGPVGVALGRAVYGVGASAEIVAEASDVAITASSDHACCGTLGRAELLLAVGESDRARAIVGNVVARARTKKSYHISRDVPEARNAPSFFQGLSGIGYQLLRTTHPEQLRSVLAFQ